MEIVGVAPEVLADPRVQAAQQAITQKPEQDAARSLVTSLAGGLEKYGVKLRPISLTVVGPMMVQMASFKPSFPEAYQMTALLFILAAPLRDVYAALEVGQRDGTAAFMAVAAEWVALSGIPQDLSQDTIAAVSETFAIAGRLIGGGADGSKKA